MSKIYIIDGNSLLFRSFYAMFSPTGEIMRSSKGFPTNALFAFHNMISSLRALPSANDRFFVAFDTGHKTFRSQKLESYKINRKPCPEDLKLQMPKAREMLDLLGIFHHEMEGYEGDDIAGSLAKYAASKGDFVELYTSDKDFLQLIDDKIEVHFLRKGLKEVEIFTEENMEEKMGFKASLVTDYKGLVGDPSDNIKGIPGVGDKTAIKLLQTYGNLESIIEAMPSLSSKMAQNVIEHREEGLLSKEIATIVTSLDVTSIYEQSKLQAPHTDELLKFYQEYELNSFIKKLNINSKPVNSMVTNSLPSLTEKVESQNVSKLSDILEPILTVRIDATEENYFKAQIFGFALGSKNHVYYITLSDALKDPTFKKFIEDPLIEKYTYDLKALIVSLNPYQIVPAGFSFDLLLATYLLNQKIEDTHGAVFKFYGSSYDESNGGLLSSNQTSIVESMHLYLLHDYVINELKERELLSLLTDVELPLTTILAQMEIEGFPIDLETLENLNKEYEEKLQKISSQIYQMVGHEININSPKQVGELLYNELKLPNNFKGSTGVDALTKLAPLHPIAKLILEQRKYQKIISSYTTGLQAHIFSDAKIHALYNQALTQTGRLSMKDPNLQNISIRSEEGKEIRKAFFYPNHEFSFLSLDYSQIELRVLASLSNSAELKEVFSKNEDIHSSTAAKIFTLPLNEVTPEMRRIAKTVNFGIVYGISIWGLSEQLNISQTEAKDIISRFNKSFPTIVPYFENVIKSAKERGYVTTILKRRRYIPEILSTNHQMMEFGKRAAMNAAIQGSAADLMKTAMLKVADVLKNYHTKMILQIHDELIFKVPQEEIDIIKPILSKAMTEALDIGVNLEVDGSIASSWFECK